MEKKKLKLSHTPHQRALRALAKLPIHVGPFVQSTTGAMVPFYTDSRTLFSHQKEFQIFIKEIVKIILKYKKNRRIGLIIGVPMAGIPLAVALSFQTKIPFAYMNKERI